ncbi:MAG: hypothetical protein NT113_06985 [Hyphomicrobiales bacterium]|nr:hypothetical protein [Hyphomicrobiales bacterium]
MFAAGLVKVLSGYPEAVIDRAIDATGIPSEVSFLNLAEIKKHLDIWRSEYIATEERRERANRKALPEPDVDPAERQRVSQGLADLVQHLKSGFSPSTQ